MTNRKRTGKQDAEWIERRMVGVRAACDRREVRLRFERGPKHVRRAAHAHKSQIKKLYGLTIEQYDAMLVEQHGRCAICGEPMTKPTIDHDHVTGKVRGLLCNFCNLTLGYLENPVKRAAAERYLEERG